MILNMSRQVTGSSFLLDKKAGHQRLSRKWSELIPPTILFGMVDLSKTQRRERLPQADSVLTFFLLHPVDLSFILTHSLWGTSSGEDMVYEANRAYPTLREFFDSAVWFQFGYEETVNGAPRNRFEFLWKANVVILTPNASQLSTHSTVQYSTVPPVASHSSAGKAAVSN